MSSSNSNRFHADSRKGFALRLKKGPYSVSAPLFIKEHPLLKFFNDLVNTMLTYFTLIANIDPAFIQYLLKTVMATQKFISLVFHNFFDLCLTIYSFLVIQTTSFIYIFSFLNVTFFIFNILTYIFVNCYLVSTRRFIMVAKLNKTFIHLQELYKKRASLNKLILKTQKALIAALEENESPKKVAIIRLLK